MSTIHTQKVAIRCKLSFFEQSSSYITQFNLNIYPQDDPKKLSSDGVAASSAGGAASSDVGEASSDGSSDGGAASSDVLGSLFELELFEIVENKINQCARLFPCNPPS